MVFSRLCMPRSGTSAVAISGSPSSMIWPPLKTRAGRNRLRRTEPHRFRRAAIRIAAADGIVGVQHREIARALIHEQARLRLGIILERVVPIQMIGRDVQRRADVGAKGLGGFELKAGQLQHVPLARRATSSPSTPAACRCCRRPAPRCRSTCRMWPVSAVVVVLPFEPVMPMISPFEKPACQFQIADDAHAALRAAFEDSADPRARRATARSARHPRRQPRVCGSTVDARDSHRHF